MIMLELMLLPRNITIAYQQSEERRLAIVCLLLAVVVVVVVGIEVVAVAPSQCPTG